MSLLVFTQDDVNRIVYHLHLAPFERRTIAGKSRLYFRLRFIEEEDERNGTDVANLVKGYLDKLDEIDTLIHEEQENGAGGVTGVSKGVDGHYDQNFRYKDLKGNDLAQLQGLRRRYEDLIRDVKRELYMIQFDNKIPLDGYNPYADYWANVNQSLILSDFYGP